MKARGKLTYDRKKRHWKIEATPDVILRLKRIFARISRKSHGALHLASSPEVCDELEWVMQRYPFEVASADRAHLEKLAAWHRETQTQVEQLLGENYRPRAFELGLPPRPYQTLAAELALATKGLLLADDVGLGKTCSALCMLSDPATRPALVVTLAHLPRQWEAEIQRFLPGATTHVLRKGTPYPLPGSPQSNSRQRKLYGDRLPDILISSYHKLNGWADVLAPIVRSVVYDEVQELRRGTESLKGSAASHLSKHADYRLGLSATPIYNYGGEIYNVLEMLRPGALGTRGEFTQEWCKDTYDQAKSKLVDPAAFGSYLRSAGLMVRRTRVDVKRELPGVTRVPHLVDSDRAAFDEVESSAAELARVILSDGPQIKGEAFSASGQLDSIVRQATGIAKAPYVTDFVRMLLESEQKIVLFGWHRAVYDVWMDRLKAFDPVLYTGSESASAKQRARDAFVTGDARVLIMSLRSGAGLDGLQNVCRTVVFGELDWSPGVHEQCTGRIYRDGQADPVVAYYLLATDGADPIMADVLQLKRAQVEGLRDPTGAVLEQLDASGQHVRKLAERYAARARKVA